MLVLAKKEAIFWLQEDLWGEASLIGGATIAKLLELKGWFCYLSCLERRKYGEQLEV